MLCCEPGCNDERAGVCGPETQTFFGKAWEERQPLLSPMTWQCWFHHLISDIMSRSTCVRVSFVLVRRVVIFWWAQIGKVVINGKEKLSAPSAARHYNFPLSTIPNHWRQALLKRTQTEMSSPHRSPLCVQIITLRVLNKEIAAPHPPTLLSLLSAQVISQCKYVMLWHLGWRIGSNVKTNLKVR